MRRTRPVLTAALSIGLIGATGIGSVRATTPDGELDEIVLDGSVQNPAFSPDGTQLLVTVWRGGYNVGPADLVVVPLDGSDPWELVADGRDNVNLPGSVWNAEANTIVYSSTEDPHDEIWMVEVTGDHRARRITLHDDEVAYEPAWSPDGDEVVYEVHPLDVEGEGRIARAPTGGSDVANAAAEVFLTPIGEDCRQPNWAPVGDLVLFQCTADGGESWTLWVSDPDGDDRRTLPTEGLNATDASFSPDGRWVVFSGDDGESSADLWAVEVDGQGLEHLTTDPGYEGAPSWSPDGTRVAFETSDGDPDGASTVVRIIDIGAGFAPA